MANRSHLIDQDILDYIRANTLREPPILRELREATLKIDGFRMQISPEQGQFMSFMARLMGAKHYLEIGTYTGYSATAVGLALPKDSSMLCCDINPDWTAIAENFWKKAGFGDRIDCRIAPALETLSDIKTKKLNTFDLVFIDADKVNYLNYYEAVLPMVRTGGVILVDNVLWGGSVCDAGSKEEATIAIRAFNQHVHEDERVDLSLIPISDGLTMLRKR